jgi:acyl-coenzyme A synthetase/AMP-(fatty) acid ligase
VILNLNIHPKDSVAAIDSYNQSLSYGELIAFSEEIKQFIPERSVVFLLTKNNIGGVAWGIGFINTKIVPLFLNSQIDESLFLPLYDLYTPQYICCPEKNSLIQKYSLVYKKYGYALLSTGNNPYALYNNLSHLLPTSGSTGSPKLVRHSYDNIEAAAFNISTFFKLNSFDKPLLVLPLYYTMGLSVVFSHLYIGATILITDLNMTDKNFWAFIKEQKATSFTGVPYSFEILRLIRFFRMNLPDLKVLTQGGGKMQRDLNMQFAEYALNTGKQWIATYGQTEGTARMAYLPPEYAIEKCGSIGKAVPNGELSLIDNQGTIINTPNIEGEMCYKGENVTLGYALSSEDLEKGDEWNGFLKTGDLAYRDKDGFYYIVGRKGRFLKLFGLRIGLDECEQIIKSEFQGIECACTGTDNKMLVYITNTRQIDEILKLLTEKTKIIASAFKVIVVDKIPKNEAGKILYSKLNKL